MNTDTLALCKQALVMGKKTLARMETDWQPKPPKPPQALLDMRTAVTRLEDLLARE